MLNNHATVANYNHGSAQTQREENAILEGPIFVLFTLSACRKKSMESYYINRRGRIDVLEERKGIKNREERDTKRAYRRYVRKVASQPSTLHGKTS